MNERPSTVRVFQGAVHLWVAGYLLSGLRAAEFLWLHPVAPRLPAQGAWEWLTRAFAWWWPEALIGPAILVLFLLAVRGLFLPVRWWSALLLWFLYVNLTDLAWLAGSGGQQLMANVLFWNILLSLPSSAIPPCPHFPILPISAFWIIRFQLLLAYLATGLHKLTGAHWLDGTALGIAATDPAYGPGWIAASPTAAALLTWIVLVFQLTFPLAVWWRPSRAAWMALGVLFHLGTAVWMDIPEMGLAFIAVYPIWMDERDARRLIDRLTPKRVLTAT